MDKWLLTPAENQDGKVLEELGFSYSDLWLINDKAYNNAEKEALFWKKRHNLLLPLRENNHHEPWSDEAHRALEQVSHRVEAVCSVWIWTTSFNV